MQLITRPFRLPTKSKWVVAPAHWPLPVTPVKLIDIIEQEEMFPETVPGISSNAGVHWPLTMHGTSFRLAFPETLLPFLEIVIVKVMFPVPLALGNVPVHVPSQGDGQKLLEIEVLVPHWLVATSTKEENVSGISPVILALTFCTVFPLKVWLAVEWWVPPLSYSKCAVVLRDNVTTQM